MEICPHCGKELELHNPADYNSVYGNSSVLAVARCCGKAVVLTPTRSRTIKKYEGERTQDDWSNEIAK